MSIARKDGNTTRNKKKDSLELRHFQRIPASVRALHAVFRNKQRELLSLIIQMTIDTRVDSTISFYLMINLKESYPCISRLKENHG